MEIGDSFFVPGFTCHVMTMMAGTAGQRHGRSFAARSVEGGSRVWRVA
jgi:hypothetical protein